MALLWKTNSGLYINKVSMKYSDPTVGTTAHFLTQPASASQKQLAVCLLFLLSLLSSSFYGIFPHVGSDQSKSGLRKCNPNARNATVSNFLPLVQSKDSKAARPVCSPHRDGMQRGTWTMPRWCWLNLYFDLRLTFEPLAIIRRNKNSSLRTVFQPKRRAPVASNRISCGSKCVTDKLRVRIGIWVWAIEEKHDTGMLVRRLSITHITDWVVACLGQNDLLLQCSWIELLLWRL